MENKEPAGEVVVRSRRKLTKSQRNLIIGIATVVGLGLAGKLLSILRRPKEKRKEKKDDDEETLESVLHVDDSDKSNQPLQAQVQRRKLANLENDEPDHEVENRKNYRRSKYVDSFSEIIPEDDIANDGEIYVNQDPVGLRDRRDSIDRSGNKERDSRGARQSMDARNEENTLTTRRSRDINFTSRSKQSQLSQGGFSIKGVSRINVEDSKNHHYDDRGKLGHAVGERGHKGDGGRRYNEKKDDERHRNEDEEGNHSDDGEGYLSEDSEYGKDHYIKDGKKYDNKGGEENRLSKEATKGEPKKNQLPVKELNITSSGLQKLPQKKPLRTSSGESTRRRKSKEGGKEKIEKTRKSGTTPEMGADKEVIFDEAGMWESINGYKVLKATTSKIPNIAEAMLKLDADEAITNLKGNAQLVREFEKEREETERAKSIWDGKIHKRKKHTEGSEAYLRIKSSVVSSVAGAEHTPEGVKVREVVKRSTLLPIPSGNESEVHSSVYNVQETGKGLKVEEIVTRTKFIPAEGDFTFSDQQLLGKQTRNFKDFSFNDLKKLTRQDLQRFLPQLLLLAAVIITVLSFITLLFSRRTIVVPSAPSVPAEPPSDRKSVV